MHFLYLVQVTDFSRYYTCFRAWSYLRLKRRTHGWSGGGGGSAFQNIVRKIFKNYLHCPNYGVSRLLFLLSSFRPVHRFYLYLSVLYFDQCTVALHAVRTPPNGKSSFGGCLKHPVLFCWSFIQWPLEWHAPFIVHNVSNNTAHT